MGKKLRRYLACNGGNSEMPLTRSVPSLRYDTCKTRVALGTRRQTHLLRTGIDRLQKWHPLKFCSGTFYVSNKISMQKFICHVSVTCSVQRRGRPMYRLFWMINRKSQANWVCVYIYCKYGFDRRSFTLLDLSITRAPFTLLEHVPASPWTSGWSSSISGVLVVELRTGAARERSWLTQLLARQDVTDRTRFHSSQAKSKQTNCYPVIKHETSVRI